MTVGQRIAQRRRELGLSQEGLGERLGVSRQAIYKWESDAALPEIEKLVNLSREFSVSIDWLLGQEDEAREPQELTPEQLRMVEEIVGRYLAAQPSERTDTPQETAERETGGTEKMETPKRRRWKWRWVTFFCAAAAAFIFASLFGRLDRIERAYQDVLNSVSQVRTDVNYQINGITNRVEEVLQSQNSLTAEQSAQVVATDYRANTATISARVVPRTYVEGMSVEFLAVSDGQIFTVPGELGEGLAYTAQAVVPLSDEITVSVVLITGERRETQVICQFVGLYERSLVGVEITTSVCDSARDGGWIASPRVDVYLYNLEDGGPVEAEVKLGLFREQRLVAWYTPAGDHNPAEGWMEFTLEETVPLDHDVSYCLAAMVTDRYGRTYMWPGMAMKCSEMSASSDHILYGRDPADWGL